MTCRSHCPCCLERSSIPPTFCSCGPCCSSWRHGTELQSHQRQAPAQVNSGVAAVNRGGHCCWLPHRPHDRSRHPHRDSLGHNLAGDITTDSSRCGESNTVFGRAVAAVGTVAEFGPLLAIWLTTKGNHQYFHRLSAKTLHSSGQFGVSLVLLIIAGAVALSSVFGLDMLLSAFASRMSSPQGLLLHL